MYTLLCACSIGTLLCTLTLKVFMLIDHDSSCWYPSTGVAVQNAVIMTITVLQVSGMLCSHPGANAVLQQQRHSWGRAGCEHNAAQAGHHHWQPVHIQQR